MMLDSFLTLAATNPVDHVVNVGYKAMDILGVKGVWVWSAHVGNLFLAGLLTILVISWAAAKIATGPASQGTNRFITRSVFAHMIEVICSYLRENTIRPLLGDRTDRFVPFLWTIFFFILFNNLLGLVPIGDVLHLADKAAGTHGKYTGLFGATATQNLFVTASLAIIAALVINLAGIRELGIGGYIKHLTAGTPWYLWFLMVPIEILSTVIKPVALALRLFANMTAGHILVAVLFMFAVSGLGLLNKGGLNMVLGPTITVVSVLSAVAIYFLELFVAFLQAFVFMFLTTVFISQLSHHHDHEHDEAHDHEHAHAH
jgi:F-type H+-transporting ATPase subunit a